MASSVFCGYGGLPAALPLHPDKHIEQGFFVTGGVSVLQVRRPKVSMKAIHLGCASSPDVPA
jgi:hypothetical protein